MSERRSIVTVMALLILIPLLTGLIAGTVAWQAKAATERPPGIPEMGISGQVITTTTDPQFLTVPAGATHARIYVETNPVCYALGSDSPNPAGGGKWPAGLATKESNDRSMLQRMRVISCTGSGAAVLNVYYTREGRSTDAVP